MPILWFSTILGGVELENKKSRLVLDNLLENTSNQENGRIVSMISGVKFFHGLDGLDS